VINHGDWGVTPFREGSYDGDISGPFAFNAFVQGSRGA
jgi:hypothetical protein